MLWFFFTSSTCPKIFEILCLISSTSGQKSLSAQGLPHDAKRAVGDHLSTIEETRFWAESLRWEWGTSLHAGATLLAKPLLWSHCGQQGAGTEDVKMRMRTPCCRAQPHSVGV